MSFLGNVLGAVIGGGLAVATGGLSLPIGAALGGGLAGLSSGGLQGAIQGATLGYTGGSLAGGLSALGLGGAAADTGATQVAQTLIEQGVSPSQAIQMAGISPAAAQAAGLTPGASVTWSDIATQAGIPFGAVTPAAGGQPGAAVTPPASLGGMISGLGRGVTPADMMSLLRANYGGVGGVGAMPWGSPSNLMTMGSGLYGLYTSEQLRKMAMAKDPLEEARAGYAGQLQGLMANPSTIISMPGYQAGLDAVQRSMAAQGYMGSGNMMAALSKYGGDFFNQEAARLANLGGFQFAPAGGAVRDAATAAQLASSSLGTLGYGTYLASNPMPAQISILGAGGIR